jgi:hypothetical protein
MAVNKKSKQNDIEKFFFKIPAIQVECHGSDNGSTLIFRWDLSTAK